LLFVVSVVLVVVNAFLRVFSVFSVPHEVNPKTHWKWNGSRRASRAAGFAVGARCKYNGASNEAATGRTARPNRKK
jgi:hypothetical protein